MKRVIVRGAARYVTYGTKAAEYSVHKGAPEERIHIAVNTVDMDWYRRKVTEVRDTTSFEEVWGLVVNEALASGLYVLCSDRAGAAYDLINEGWNGALFDPHNLGELALLIQQAKEQIEEIRTHREAISEHACGEYSIERLAKAFLDAIKFVQVGDQKI